MHWFDIINSPKIHSKIVNKEYYLKINFSEIEINTIVNSVLKGVFHFFALRVGFSFIYPFGRSQRQRKGKAKK